MMQPAAGVVPPPMAPPSMDQQQHHHQQYQHHPHQQQQQPQQQQQQQQPWMMMPPQPQPQQPPPVWNQQPQVPQPAPQQQQQPPLQQQPQQSQYPAAAPTAAPAQPASADEIRTLWIGDLQYWMEETYIHGCFAHTGEVASVKVIRNKQTGQSEGYGFIEFVNRAAADRILQTYNGTLIPGTEQAFRLNWASFSAGERRTDDGADFPIFVGDLASDVTDYMLQETFRSHYSTVKGAKVVTDRATGRSKGYGFVRFGDESEQVRAMTEMNGVFCSTRPMRIGPAATKKNTGGQQQYPAKTSYQTAQATQSENDPNNTTIFVGALDPNVTDDHLRQVFSQFGELIHVKIPLGKRCGFVQFANRACAEEALLMLNGTQLGGQNIRLSWGRSPNKQPQADPNQWNGGGGGAATGGYYGYGQGYEAYGYAPPAQDPNMYAYGAYPGYGNYQQQQ